MTDDVSISGAQLLSTNKMASIAESCQYFSYVVVPFLVLMPKCFESISRLEENDNRDNLYQIIKKIWITAYYELRHVFENGDITPSPHSNQPKWLIRTGTVYFPRHNTFKISWYIYIDNFTNQLICSIKNSLISFF